MSFHWTCLKYSERLPHSQNSLIAAETQFKDISPWNICQIITKTVLISTRIVISYTMKVSLMRSQWILREQHRHISEIITKTVLISTRIVISYMMKVSLMGSQWILREQHGHNFPMKGKPSEDRNKCKRAELWESQSNIQEEKLTIWVRPYEILTKFTRSTSSTRPSMSVLIMDVKVSKDKHIGIWIDWKKLIYVRWNRIKYHA